MPRWLADVCLWSAKRLRLPVCHIEAVLNLRQAYVSQQLVVLRKANLVLDHKDGLIGALREADLS